MSAQVVFLSAAEQDLKELKDYIVKNFGKDSWQASYSTIKETINTLKTFPLSGKIPEEIEILHLTQFRQVLSGMNRIIYEVRQETIYIHIVCDVRKDMKSHLTRRLLRAS
ncbi:MAG: type II toxin-antitoxin system RelE/ParE family toxin [Burkholderiaceae bacterium]